MLPENIDDLFRDKLDGHATPPCDALWARLQAQPSTEADPEPGTETTDERLDQLFQARLNTHPTPPAREHWERLEDEYLRPRKRRAAAWWPMALAAAVALLLVAGGAGLWLGFPTLGTQNGTVAAPPKPASKAAGREAFDAPNKQAPTSASSATLAASNHAPKTLENATAPALQKNFPARATRPQTLASTASKARTTAPGQSPRHLKGTNRQPDAASDQPLLVAHTTAPAALRPTHPAAADEPRANPLATAVAVAPAPVPAPEIVPAALVPAPSLASAGTLITVDVRNGAAPVARPARIISSALAEAAAPDEHRRLGGRLLQQASHLVRGERVSLAEITGLPENVTLRATVGGRSVSKSIRL